MNRVLSRAYGVMIHERTIRCVFDGFKAKYSIPIYFDTERRSLGHFLEIELDLGTLDKELLLNKKFRSTGCCDDKPEHWKSVFNSYVPTDGQDYLHSGSRGRVPDSGEGEGFSLPRTC